MQAPCYLKSISDQTRVRAEFVGRVPGVEVDTDREATVARLRPFHKRVVKSMGFEWSHLHRAEQVHGAEIAVVSGDGFGREHSGVDGLITATPGLLLGIYVADCGAVFISDPIRGVIALLHSGKKGTEKNITGKAIALMVERFNSRPKDIVVALAPCIRPPAYEVDFAAQIKRQVLHAEVPEAQWTDSGVCTSSDLEAYYSYRMEMGKTGRMLALLGLRHMKVGTIVTPGSL